jgi:hypothetical protein
MAGLVPAIHVSFLYAAKMWMPGTSPGMTVSLNGRGLSELLPRLLR